MLASAAVLGGCRLPTLPGTGRATFQSAESSARLAPDLKYRSYTYSDLNTADVYMTDIPPEVLEDPARLAQASGQILHVHMFLKPRPGRTPIERTACSATVRYVVLAEGRAGVYAGGGFLFPGGTPDGGRFSGVLPEATLALDGKTEGFRDALGRGVFSTRFSAGNDEELARVIRRAADRVALSVEQ